tara:strand:- start:542 stop:1099 length:558 start_codon:yes stop_codon:yes gene_type:complete
MSLDLIIGPMFSGKTTELIRRLYTLSSINKKCIYINSTLDDREESDISSHNPNITKINVDSVKVNKFDDTILNTISNYDVIGIDESQLFNDDIVKFVLHIVDNLHKKVIMCGLNSDYKRDKFGYILDLVPHCDTIIKLYPYCTRCSKKGLIIKALFSKRISGENNEIIDIGYDNYVPLCRECYNN